MAGWRCQNFGGVAPAVHPTLLPETGATRAHNCLLKDGKLTPLRRPARLGGVNIRPEGTLERIADAKTIYYWHRGDIAEVLAWNGAVRVTGSNIASDISHRVFVSGDTGIGGVGKNHPAAYIAEEGGVRLIRHSIVKGPMPPPEVSVPPPADLSNVRYTVFVQTWVDQFGYESPPSVPSVEVEYNDGARVSIGSNVAPDGASKRRIWKAVTGLSTDNIQFVAEQSAVSGLFPEFAFTILDENAGETLPNMAAPPEDLAWMSKVPGNFYVGFSRSNRREVRFSEAGYPTFWPEEYGRDIHDDIVGLGVTLNSVFVLTRGMPYVLTGTSPDTMVASVLASPQGCVSERSICIMEGAVFFASMDGICMVQDGSVTVRVLTHGIFTRRQWQEFKPENCMMAAHNGTLYAWFGGEVSVTGQKAGGIAISLLDDSKIAVVTHDELASAACADAVTDELYYVRGV